MPNLTAARFRASLNAALSRSPPSGCSLGRADVHLGDPPVAELQPQPAHHRAVRQELVLVLPALDAEHLVEPVLDEPGVDVGQRQRPVVLDHLRLELHLLGVERGGQRGGDRLHVGGSRVVADSACVPCGHLLPGRVDGLVYRCDMQQRRLRPKCAALTPLRLELRRHRLSLSARGRGLPDGRRAPASGSRSRAAAPRASTAAQVASHVGVRRAGRPAGRRTPRCTPSPSAPCRSAAGTPSPSIPSPAEPEDQEVAGGLVGVALERPHPAVLVPQVLERRRPAARRSPSAGSSAARRASGPCSASPRARS